MKTSILLPTFNNSDNLFTSFKDLDITGLNTIYVRDNFSTDNTYNTCASLFSYKLFYTRNSSNFGAIRNHELVIGDLDSGHGVIFGDDDIVNQEYISYLISSDDKFDLVLPSRNIPPKVSNLYAKAWFASQSIPGLTASHKLFKEFWPVGYNGLYPQVFFVLNSLSFCNVHFTKIQPIKKYSNMGVLERVDKQNRDIDYNFSERLNILSIFVNDDVITNQVIPYYIREITHVFSSLSYVQRFKAIYYLISHSLYKFPFKYLVFMVIKCAIKC